MRKILARILAAQFAIIGTTLGVAAAQQVSINYQNSSDSGAPPVTITVKYGINMFGHVYEDTRQETVDRGHTGTFPATLPIEGRSFSMGVGFVSVRADGMFPCDHNILRSRKLSLSLRVIKERASSAMHRYWCQIK